MSRCSRFFTLCLVGLPLATLARATWSAAPTAQPLSLAAPAAAAPQPRAETKTPSARLTQGDARLARLESYIVDKVNAERKQLNLRPLATDSLLAEVARAHSAEMRDKGYFAHESPTTTLREPLDRYVLAFGETPRLIAENIYRQWSTGPQALTTARADTAHKALMNSPGHRANILLPNATRIGVGLVANANGDIWLTENFSRP